MSITLNTKQQISYYTITILNQYTGPLNTICMTTFIKEIGHINYLDTCWYPDT